MRKARVWFGMATTAFLLAGLLAAQSGAAGGATASAATCVPATNIEAIVDDSGSMSITDDNRLRVQAMDLLIGTLPGNTQLGAVEFGSAEEFEGKPAADTVFPPEPVGANASSMRSLLKKLIQADNGSTDYNGAFAKADADNPTAAARIFLTDGGHNLGEYTEAHLAHNVPTYVIGFSTGLAGAEDRARLEKIANDTGGKVFQLNDAALLQPVMNNVGAALTCQTPPREFNDSLKQGDSKTHRLAIGASTKVLQIVVSWANPSDKFTISNLKLLQKGKVVAAAPRPKRPAKLKVKRTQSSTFVVLKVSGLRKGTLKFTIKGKKVSSGSRAKVTTQVGRGSGH
jgi:hypothetical protein